MYDLIALSGKQFAGKDLFAEYLLQELPEYSKTPLARAIKEEFGHLYRLTPSEIESHKSVYRPGLIALGQRRREQNPDYWLDKVLNLPGSKIISDVRLQREFDRLKQRHAFLIRIESDRSAREQRGALVHENDATECELDQTQGWDEVVVNNGSREELKAIAKQIAAKIKRA